MTCFEGSGKKGGTTGGPAQSSRLPAAASRFGVEKLQNFLAQISLNEGVDRTVGIKDAVADKGSKLVLKSVCRLRALGDQFFHGVFRVLPQPLPRFVFRVTPKWSEFAGSSDGRIGPGQHDLREHRVVADQENSFGLLIFLEVLQLLVIEVVIQGSAPFP